MEAALQPGPPQKHNSPINPHFIHPRTEQKSHPPSRNPTRPSTTFITGVIAASVDYTQQGLGLVGCNSRECNPPKKSLFFSQQHYSVRVGRWRPRESCEMHAPSSPVDVGLRLTHLDDDGRVAPHLPIFTIGVSVEGHPGPSTVFETQALEDTGATANFISLELAEQMGCEPVPDGFCTVGLGDL